MTVCDVSVVLGAGILACPSECPFWSQSAVWKGVGVCTRGDRCSVYNPLLSYADDVNNVCLPCGVYGCVSCAYSEGSLPVLGADSTRLPDVCLECAPGYRMGDDGHRCYLVKSSIWSRSFYALVATTLVCFAGLGLRMLLRPSQYESNLNRYHDAVESQKIGNWSTKLRGDVFGTLLGLMRVDVAGVGVILYFRFLAFLASTIFGMILLNLAHAHIPCSDMIRSFKKPFSLDRVGDLSSGVWWQSYFKLARSVGLRDHVLNFKYVDDAIDWSVSQYAQDTSRVMGVVYLCVMGATIVFALYQRNFLQNYFNGRARVQYFTLVLDGVPPLHSLEDFVEDATGVRPKSVAVAYDIGDSLDGMRDFLNVLEEDNNDGIYVNLEMASQHRRVLNELQPSGTAFAVFGSRQAVHRARVSFERSGICGVRECDLEPEDVIWSNLSKGESLFGRVVCITAVICAAQLLWTFLFFMPYAAYKLLSLSSDFFESMWLCLFAGVGNSLVGAWIRLATDRVGFMSRETSESYLMWISAAAKLFNVGVNVLLAHMVNYGGRYKLVSVVKDFGLYMRTPTFRVGEEVSISQSLAAFMSNVLLLVPLLSFLFARYGTPLLKFLFVLSADLDESESKNMVRASRFDLSERYCISVVHFTCSLLLQFVIQSKLQALTLTLCLLGSCLLHYGCDAYMLLYKSSPTRVVGFASFYNALLLWSVPTGILAACPSYWRWRGANGRLSTVLICFLLHMVCYHGLMRYMYGLRRRFDVVEHNNSPSDYTMGNPVYTLRRLAAF
ncbi:uncharacterized protein BXIN_0562 [Babesia sp. Xinjiang]|uniref:uncharacterized protein n=1 Tax=Babesia sp. Xinjiang TaxID=462227 RepID=UPI000A21972B|nr:uncharacterized protein BXIN_0562 [Babesia sp. Xinjiang]ORM41859.1 hypothetical protein BXIN_0562 [Babesia sp. Xinjiang]